MKRHYFPRPPSSYIVDDEVQIPAPRPNVKSSWMHADGHPCDLKYYAQFYKGFVYLLTGFDPATSRRVKYIGKHESFDDAYCGSGALLDQFPDRAKWMSKYVLQFSDNPLRDEYLCQLAFVGDIKHDNYVDGGSMLNLQVIDPDGVGDSHFHRSRKWNTQGSKHGKGGSGGGGAVRQVYVEYSDGRPAKTFASVKAFEDSIGAGKGNGSTLRGWLLDKQRKYEVDPGTALHLRYRNPQHAWEKHNIKEVRYA